MVDLVIPVNAPGATAAAAQIDQVANASSRAAVAGDKVIAVQPRMAAGFRAATAGAAVAGASFGGMAKSIGSTAGRLVNISGLLPGIGGRLAAMGALGAAFGPLGIAIAGVSLALNYMSERAEAAKKKLEDIADTEKKIADASKERASLVENIANISQGAGAAVGASARAAIAAGVDPLGSQRLVTGTTDANQALQLDALLKKSNLNDEQRLRVERESALVSRAGGDRLSAAQIGIDQFDAAGNRSSATGGIFGPGRRRGTSTIADRLGDQAGIDSGTKQGENFFANINDPRLRALDAGQAGETQKQKELIRNAFDQTGLDAVAEVTKKHTPAIKENTGKIQELDKTVRELNRTLKDLQKPGKKISSDFLQVIGY